MRLSNPIEHTLPLAKRLALAGSSWITLHARFGASTRKRRHGPADLGQVKLLKEGLQVPVISNGNVRTHGDVVQNLEFTCADGVMVGETLLGNPWYAPGLVPTSKRLTRNVACSPTLPQTQCRYLWNTWKYADNAQKGVWIWKLQRGTSNTSLISSGERIRFLSVPP